MLTVPTSPMQRAYFTGINSDIPLGGLECVGYLEFRNKKLDISRLENALKQLSRNAVFNCQFLDRNTITPSTYKDIEIKKIYITDAEIDNYSTFFREQFFSNSIDITKGKMLDIALSITETQTIIHLGFSLAVIDFHGIALFSHQLAEKYNQQDCSIITNLNTVYESVSLDFTVHTQLESKVEKLPSPPQLLSQNLQPNLTIIDRYSYFYSQEQWKSFEEAAKRYNASPAALFLALYSQALRHCSENDEFIITLAGLRVKHSKYLLGMRTTAYLHRSYPNTNFDELVKQTHRDLRLRMRQNIEAPEEILSQVKQHGHVGISPYVLTYAANQRIFDELTTETLGTPHCWGQTPQVIMDCQVFNIDGERIEIGLDVRRDTLDKNIINTILEAICQQINDIINNKTPSLLISSHTARQRLEINSLPPACDPNWLYSPFRNKVTEQPHSPALLFSLSYETPTILQKYYPDIISDSHGEISYARLDEMARQIAAFLINKVPTNSVVGIHLPKGAEQIIAVLGVLYSGCTYLPLNIHIPEERLQYICQSANVAYILTEQDFSEISTYSPLFEPRLPCETDIRQAASSSLAYIIYTSGSTGQPKGVAISHYSALNTIYAVNQQNKFNARDRILAVSALEFDLSVYDIFGLLSCGGSIVALNENEKKDAFAWGELVKKFDISIWNSVPALVEMLLIANDKLPSLRRYLCSGDWISYDLFERIQLASPNSILVAMGGATEAAIWSNIHIICNKEDLNNPWQKVPYGKPLAGQQYRVVKVINDCDKPSQIFDCADGVSGELWIGGVGLAAEYYRDEVRTKKSFIHTDGGETASAMRWYRTGDIGFWHKGILYFLGRKDNQVKINGYRIECGEVEQALSKLSEVDKAVVVPIREHHALGAVVVAHDALTTEMLQNTLARTLPTYMIPEQFVFSDTLVLTSNGKVDRKWAEKLLSQLSFSNHIHHTDHSSKTKLLEQCRETWQVILGLNHIHNEDNFFALGGDSLSATKVCAELRKKRISVGVDKLFTHPNLSDFAQICSLNIENTSSNISTIDCNTAFPLTPLQRAYALGSDGVVGIVSQATICSFILKTSGEHPVSIWCESLNRLINQTPALRLVRKNEHQQCVEASPLELKILPKGESLKQYLLQACPNAEQAPCIEMLIVENDPLHIGLAMNYLCHDASSLLMIIEAWISEVCLGKSNLPSDIEAFVHYAQHQESIANKQTNLLSDYPPPQLPLKPIKQQYHLPQSLTFTLSAQARNDLEKLAKQQQITVTALLLHAFGQALAYSCHQNVITICLPVSYRPDDIPQALGNFSQLRLCRSIQGETIQKLNQDLSHAVSGRAPGFSQIASSGRASYPVVFTSTLGSVAESIFSGKQKVVWAHTRTPGVLLDCQISPADKGINIRWDYLDGVIESSFFATLQQQFIAQMQNLGITMQILIPPYEQVIEACISDLLTQNLKPKTELSSVLSTWQDYYPAIKNSNPELDTDITYLKRCLLGDLSPMSLWQHPHFSPEAILHQVLIEESFYARFYQQLKMLNIVQNQKECRCLVLGSGIGIIYQELIKQAHQNQLSLQFYPIEPSAELAKHSHQRGVYPLTPEECPAPDIIVIPASLHRDSRIETLLRQFMQCNPQAHIFIIEITGISAATQISALLDPSLLNPHLSSIQSAQKWKDFFIKLGVIIDESHEWANLLYCSAHIKNTALPEYPSPVLDTNKAISLSDDAQIAALWQKVLSLNHLPGAQEDFFQLGGDSLKATQIVGELRSKGYAKLRLADLFNHSKLQNFARYLATQAVETSINTTPPILKVKQSFALSDVQQAYLAGQSKEQILGGVGAHCYFEYQAENNALDTQKFANALAQLVQRHPILQAGIIYQNEQALGQFAAVNPPKIEYCDNVREKTAHEIPDASIQSPLVLRISTDRRTIGIGMNNLLLDGQSMWQILHELDLAYAGQTLPLLAVENIPNLPPTLSAQNAHYNIPPAPPLPYQNSLMMLEVPKFARYQTDLDNSLWLPLQQLARNAQLTPASLLTAAYAFALSKQLSIETDFSLNLTTFVRPEAYQQSLGDFTVLRLLPINWQLIQQYDLLALAHHIQKTLADLQDSEHNTIHLSRAIVRQTGNPIDGLFPVVLTCGLGLNGQQRADKFSFGHLVYACSQTPQVTLDLQVYDDERGLHLSADYVSQLLTPTIIEQILEAILETLCALRPSTQEKHAQPLKARLTHLWQNHLALASDTVPDNFFRDGGDSLRATRFIRELQQQIHPEISLRTLIQQPNFSDFLSAIEQLEQHTEQTEEGVL